MPLSETGTGAETAYLIHPETPQKPLNRTNASIIEELEGLARAISLDIQCTKQIKVSRIQAGHFIGKGQRHDIGAEIEAIKPNIVIFNHSLSPVQQRNLENEWDVKVIDRTGLILEIFGARAQTKEGLIQVELAAQDYQRSRLVRSWTHLERQRGGAGFMGGPGERQIELDRRMIATRIKNLKQQLEDVRRTRTLGRESRARIPLPVVALVGYTNAGKSTLFNTLTESKVFAQDLLFATLDPTLRKLSLPGKREVILSDTVGFISELPTNLIAAFRATLEQVLYADVIAHVIDVSQGDYRAQRQDVIKILTDLGINYDDDDRIIEVFNKIDAISAEDEPDFIREANFSDNKVAISALKSQGLDDFQQKCSAILGKSRIDASYEVDIRDGKALSWLYDHGEVLSRKDTETHTHIRVMLDEADAEKFKTHYHYTNQS